LYDICYSREENIPITQDGWNAFMFTGIYIEEPMRQYLGGVYQHKSASN
jgi:hypothetical protein